MNQPSDNFCGASRLAYLLLVIALLLTAASIEFIPRLFTDGRQFAKFLNEHDEPIAQLTLVILLVVTFPFRPHVVVERTLRALAASPLPLAAAVGIVLALGSRFIYQSWPVTMDEYSPWFQAHVFAGGAVSAKYPPDVLNHLFERGYHSNFFIINWSTGQVVSGYWPGFALLLAPFAALGVPWLCNPVLVALTVVALHRLAVALGLSAVQVGWVTLFAVASPAFTLTGISFYSMPAHLLLNTLFALCLANPNPRRLCLAGLIGGYALCLHNPLPHLAFAAPWIGWQLASGGERLKRLGWLLGGYLPFSLLLGLGWVLVMRDVAAGPLAAALAAVPAAAVIEVKPLWAVLAGYFRFFSWPSEFILASRLGGLIKLWLWAVPLLPLVGALGVLRTRTAPQRLLLASALTTLLVYFFIPFDQGHGWGYRYFHPAWSTLPILAALALAEKDIAGVLSSRLALCVLISLAVLTPMRAWQMGQFVSEHVAQVPGAKQARAENECDIIFHSRKGFYGIDMVENRPNLRSCGLTFISRGRAADEAFAQQFAPGGRPVARDTYGWIYRYVRLGSGP